MIRILVINGSPRSNGNTLKITQSVEQKMKEIDSSVEFKYIHLSKIDLQTCKGCYRCLAEGQDKCPIKDDQKKIEGKMDWADALIFSTPVYVANVSWIFKNFLDRFAYICHRPRYHGKKAMVVCSTGSVASGVVNIILKFSVETWGFEVVSKVGAIVSPAISENDRIEQKNKNEKKAGEAAEKFYRALRDRRRPSAKFVKLCTFNMQKRSFRYADPEKSDFIFWKTKGWLERGTGYYTDAKVNPIKNLLAKIFAVIELKKYPRGRFLNEI